MSASSPHRLGAALLLGGLLWGCGGEQAPARVKLNAGPPTKAVCPTDQTLTYASFGQAFINKYCIQCHSESLSSNRRMAAPLGTDYDTVEDVRMLAASIDKWAAAGPEAMNRLMPPNDPKPTDEERTQLGLWLACGAP